MHSFSFVFLALTCRCMSYIKLNRGCPTSPIGLLPMEIFSPGRISSIDCVSVCQICRAVTARGIREAYRIRVAYSEARQNS